MRLLLALGASPAAVDSSRCTPLHLSALAPEAKSASAAAIVAALLQAGAPKDAADVRGQTTLHHFATRPGSTDAIKALLAAGAQAKLPDAAEQTPLGCALAAGNQEAVELLLLPPSEFVPAHLVMSWRGYGCITGPACGAVQSAAGQLLVSVVTQQPAVANVTVTPLESPPISLPSSPLQAPRRPSWGLGGTSPLSPAHHPCCRHALWPWEGASARVPARWQSPAAA